jgi:hypothetical protein
MVGVTVERFPNDEVAVSAGGAVEKDPEGVDACSVASRPEGGVGVPGAKKLQDSITSIARTRNRIRRFFIPQL